MQISLDLVDQWENKSDSNGAFDGKDFSNSQVFLSYLCPFPSTRPLSHLVSGTHWTGHHLRMHLRTERVLEGPPRIQMLEIANLMESFQEEKWTHLIVAAFLDTSVIVEQ